MDFIDRIGPVLGLVAFLGLAVMTFLTFMQAREVRRLREWAGRAPERALEADEATKAAAEAKGESKLPKKLGWFGELRERMADRLMPAWEEADRRSPVDLKILGAVLLTALIAAAALTGGFGLVGGGEDHGKQEAKKQAGQGKSKKLEVAVLNATQENGVVGVQGLATKVADKVVRHKGFKPTVETNAPSGIPDSVVMYRKDADKGSADDLAKIVSRKLGQSTTAPMSVPVRQLSKGAPLALLIGRKDADF